MQRSPRFFVSTVLCALVLGFVPWIQAASETWNQTGAGPYTWTTSGNWVSGTVPNGNGSSANVSTDLTANQVISLGGGTISLGSLTFGDAVAAAGNFTQTIGTGTFNFQGANAGDATSITLSTSGNPSNTFSAGIIMGGSSPLTITAGGTARVTFSGPRFDTNGATLTLVSSATSLANGAGTAGITISGTLTGTSMLVKMGGGTVNLTGTNTITGPVEIRGGDLAVEGTLKSKDITVYGNGLAGLPADTNNQGAATSSYLRLGRNTVAPPAGGWVDSSGTLTLRGGGLMYGGAASAWTSTIGTLAISEGYSAVLVKGQGATGIATFTNLTRAAGATLQLRTADSNPNPFVTGSVAVSAMLIGGGGADGTQTISILPWAIGNTTNPSNEGLNFITYSSGTLRPLLDAEYATSLTTGTATANVAIGSTALAVSSTINALKFTGAGALAIAAGQSLQVTSGGIVFTNTGSITVGTLNFGAKEGIVFAGVNLDFAGGVSNNAISATITGSGGFTKSGFGTLTLSGSNNFSGLTTVNTGTLRIGNASALSVSNDVVLANTSNYSYKATRALVVTGMDLNGFSQTIGSLAGGGEYGGHVLLGSGTLTTGGSNVSTVYSGSIGGSGALVKVGTGTMTLNGRSGYSGGTRVNAGTLLVNNSGGSATGSGAVVVAASGSTNFGKLGGGSGVNNGGTLGPLDGGATLSTYTPNVTGILSGAVTINQFAHLAPGNSVGTLTFGALTLDNGSVLDYEFNGMANDFTSVAGALSLDNAGVVGINLYVEGTTNPYATGGLYNLFSYGSLSSAFQADDFAVLNPDGGFTYSFVNNTGSSLIQLQITPVPEPSTVVLCAMGFSTVLYGLRGRRKYA